MPRICDPLRQCSGATDAMKAMPFTRRSDRVDSACQLDGLMLAWCRFRQGVRQRNNQGSQARD
eukprot:862862-Alexandrium_andersonii.AAC.1